ncbi:sugar phosphate isomerase/epimerase [Lutimonas saemankumensis]|uniref:sugar phosphate isomerase/epimerase family protein n=1 Tax=Lutimonas saemankumensis TaxID=483016 RepID=UPI001CD6F59A|nr:TIM barrel protein [Lutimonas saemankumensis]MCA0933329.1 sugar phosphate isomerase/epimerase [Lutimonas saemankumensis]
MEFKKKAFKGLFFIGILALIIQGFTTIDPLPKDDFIGLQLYSVRQDMNKDAKGTVEKVGQMGFKFVEAAGYRDGKFYGMEPLEFKKLCEDNGLQFLGSHTGQNLPTKEKWEETMTWWDQAIEAHATAGVKWIVQPWMSREGYESLDGLKKYVEYFNAVGEKCRAKGIYFGYHNHNKEFTTEFDGKPLYDHMLELSDPDKVMFQLDLYWINKGGKDALDYFKRYPGRFMLWHIKDEKELGESGKMDFTEIFKHKKESGLKYGIVEVEKYNFTPLVSVQKSLDYLKSTNY